jgi:hypothetical protein
VVHLTNTQILIAFAIYSVIGSAVWLHADRNGIRHQTAWALFVVFFFAIALPIYVIYVRRRRRNAS